MAILEGKNLTIRNKANNLIMNDFSFSIEPGEIWIVMGPNGIGKSSLWEALIGILPIASGQLLLNNRDITHITPAKRVRLGMKYIAQNNALIDDITVEENLLIVAESLVKISERKRAIEKAVTTFSLEHLLTRRADELSGGQRRRVELSKITIGPSSIILLDEPFAAVDEEYTQKITDTFSKLKKEGKSLLINDHNAAAMRSIADYCIHLGHAREKGKTYIEKINN